MKTLQCLWDEEQQQNNGSFIFHVIVGSCAIVLFVILINICKFGKECCFASTDIVPVYLKFSLLVMKSFIRFLTSKNYLSAKDEISHTLWK